MKKIFSTRVSLIIWICTLLALISPIYAADDFLRISGDQFTYKGTVYRLKGTNYYPRDHMWADMWNSWDWNEMQVETTMIRDLGMNCVRILVPYSHGGWNGPNVPEDRLQKLESLVNLFGQKGIRSCITLFDWETTFPPAGSDKEAEHLLYLKKIVNRLKDNKYVFMWDVKNEPDHPSNILGLDNWDYYPAKKNQIVSWLQRMCAAVHNPLYGNDNNHPASVGLRWWQNVDDVIGFVEVAMFHSYWPNVSQQITDIKGYLAAAGKNMPIICEEFGWPTNPTPCLRDGVYIYDYTEAKQLELYQMHLTQFANHNISGCMQWMTFDSRNYTTDPNVSFENYFGLWKYNYTLKPAAIYYRDNFVTSPFPDDVPPGPVTSFRTVAGGGGIQLYWTNPSDADFTGTMIRYKTTGYPTSPTDGFLVCTKPGTRGAADTFTHTGLTNGVKYYYAAFAYDIAPNYSSPAFTTGIPGDITCATARKMPDGTSVLLTNRVVTAVFPSDGYLYIEDPNRVAGIKVNASTTGLAIGDIVHVAGTLGTWKPDSINPSARHIAGATVTKVSSGSPLQPVAMKCLSVGGGPIPPYVPGVTEGSYEPGIGLNNIGSLVRIAGKVTKVIGNYLYVDDGSDIQDIWDFNGFRTGVLVQYVSTPPVSVGNYVIVTGVVEGSIPAGWTTNRRFIRCRVASDLIKVHP